MANCAADARPAPRGDRQGGAQAAGAARDRRPSRSRARTFPAKVTGGAAYVQDIRLPGMTHGRVVRPPRYGAEARKRRRGGRAGDAGRCRGRARRQLPRRRRRARGAGDQGARRACRQCQMERRHGNAGSRPSCSTHLMALPTQDHGRQREADGGDRPASRTIEATYRRPYHGARLDWPVLRGRRIQGRQAHRVDALAGRVSAASATSSRR